MTTPKDQFYWFNEVNFVEGHGPFPSIEKAKENCVLTYKAIDTIALSILILKVVGRGEVKATINHHWKEEKE